MRNNQKENSLKDKTAKGLFWGGLSNGVQQLLNLLFGICLARLLSPGDYGMVGMLTIFILIAGVLQESGFVMALVNKRNISHKDYNAVFWFTTFMGATLYTILFFAAPLIADFYDKPELVDLSRALFICIFISSISITHNAYLLKNLMIKQRAIAQTTALIISGTIGVFLAFNGFTYWGIVIQSISYTFVSTAVCWYLSGWTPVFNLDFSPLKSMFAFSWRLMATNLVVHLNNNILTVLLGRFFSVTDVGLYTQASKWTNMGYSLVNGMITSVAQPVLVQVDNDDDRKRNVFRKMLRFTSFISFPLMFGLAFVAPELIVIAVTDKWAPCVPFIQMLCLSGAFFPIQTLYSNLIISKGKSEIQLYSTISQCLLLLTLVLAVRNYGIDVMISLSVCLNVCWIGIWQYFAKKTIAHSFRSALVDICPFMVAAAFTMVLTYFFTLSISNIYCLFTIKILVAVIIYAAMMRVSSATIFNECFDYLRNKIKK